MVLVHNHTRMDAISGKHNILSTAEVTRVVAFCTILPAVHQLPILCSWGQGLGTHPANQSILKEGHLGKWACHSQGYVA